MTLVTARDILCDDLLVVPPAVEPLSLEAVKLQRRFTSATLDDRFTAWITAAREHFEASAGLQLITATRVFLLECFPAQTRIAVWRAPVRSILSIEYLDASETVQVVDPTTYEMFPPLLAGSPALPLTGSPYPSPGGVQLRGSTTWPVSVDRAGAVRILYTAGFGTSGEDVPAIIRDYALMQHIGDMHKFAENLSERPVMDMPMGTTVIRRSAQGRMIPVDRLTRW